MQDKALSPFWLQAAERYYARVRLQPDVANREYDDHFVCAKDRQDETLDTALKEWRWIPDTPE
jgi:hypothetical protein